MITPSFQPHFPLHLSPLQSAHTTQLKFNIEAAIWRIIYHLKCMSPLRRTKQLSNPPIQVGYTFPLDLEQQVMYESYASQCRHDVPTRTKGVNESFSLAVLLEEVHTLNSCASIGHRCDRVIFLDWVWGDSPISRLTRF